MWFSDCYPDPYAIFSYFMISGVSTFFYLCCEWFTAMCILTIQILGVMVKKTVLKCTLSKKLCSSLPNDVFFWNVFIWDPRYTYETWPKPGYFYNSRRLTRRWWSLSATGDFGKFQVQNIVLQCPSFLVCVWTNKLSCESYFSTILIDIY